MKSNHDLAPLMNRLIGTIEGRIETSTTETVPKISRFAADLL